ncbi:MAG: hypothetical protein QXU98_12960 [Candidatus Parvarchaeota archaeon]
MSTITIPINATKGIKAITSTSSISSYIWLVIIAVIFIAIIVIVYLLVKGSKKPKQIKDAFFTHLKSLYTSDLKLNEKAYLILPTKRLSVRAYKKEMWSKKEFYIIQVSKFLTTDFYFISAIEFKSSPKDKQMTLIAPQNVNFYTIGKGFIVEADLIPIFENYITDTGIFRTTAETTLNQLYENRTKERVLESNALADSLKLKEAEKENFIETYKEMQKTRQI